MTSNNNTYLLVCPYGKYANTYSETIYNHSCILPDTVAPSLIQYIDFNRNEVIMNSQVNFTTSRSIPEAFNLSYSLQDVSPYDRSIFKEKAGFFNM